MDEYRDVHGSKAYLQIWLTKIKNSSMSEKQKKLIEEFFKDLRIGKAGKKVGPRRIGNYLQFLLNLDEYFHKDLEKVTEDDATKLYTDLQDNVIKKKNGMPYAQASKDEFVKTLKRYLGWLWGKNSIRYRKSISWMKEDYKGSEKNAITLEQAEKIVEAENSLRNQCLFIFAFDSGGRIEEILNVRIKDISVSNADKKYYIVKFRGEKTPDAKRTIPIPIASTVLYEWLKSHPTKQEQDYLFPLMYDNAKKIIKNMSKRVLDFDLKPHELRHSSATHYIQFGGFGAENIGGFYYRYGWKFGSKEALTYIKTYLYSGEVGVEKVAKAIDANRVDKLKAEIDSLKRELDTKMNSQLLLGVLNGIIKQQQMMSQALSELSGKRFDLIIPEKLKSESIMC
ncbi:MAG: site-specific integrase [Candidatus Zixiibacteriota bacterium]